MTNDSTSSALQPELAVLRWLTHLQCATVAQLHAACFPGAAIASVRERLRRLVAAGYVTHTPWHLPRTQRERGQIWTILPAGVNVLRRYEPLPAVPTPLDLGCPTTALERDEWRIRLAIRTFVIQLIHAARQQSFLAQMYVAAPLTWPTPLVGPEPVVPEASLRIAWEPAVQHDPQWLPWPAPSHLDAATTYHVFVDRSGAIDTFVAHAERGAPHASDVLVFIAETADRLHALRDVVRAAPRRTPVRLTCWTALDAGITADGWYDAHGLRGRLPLRTYEVIGAWHVPTLA